MLSKLLLIALPLLLVGRIAADVTSFNVTAIAAVNKRSVLQCWRLTTPVTSSTTTGIEGAVIQNLGNVSGMVWSSLPPNYAGTPHPAPSVQWNAVLSGQLRVTIPGSNDRVYVTGGKYGLILATDTADVSTTGHISSIGPFLEGTALMIPTLNGVIPPHVVLHSGACVLPDLQY